MTEIRRETLFSKLNALTYQSLESATAFCKVRGHAYVELLHWALQLFEHESSDWRRLASAFQLDAARLAADLTRALDRLPRGATTVQDLSPHVDRAVERAWVYASLLFEAKAIRSGHVLYAALKEPELSHSLRSCSREFEKISHQELARRFHELLQGAPESVATLCASESNRKPAEEFDEATLPARPGNQEALKRYAVDLTACAARGELDPIIGRDTELRQIIDILMRRRQNNPILTGEAGVGKTAVVEGLALRIAQGEVPPPLRNVRLCALDLGLLQAGASMKGEFEQRLRHVIDDVQASTKPIILFIDEAHTLIGAGGAAGTGDAANLLKPALARGTLRTIAATTFSEYKKHIEKDPALTRRFQVVQVCEPDEYSALRMVRGMSTTLERHHQVQLLDEALEAAVKLSHRYIPARQLPDKAMSLLDTACARVAVSQHATPPAVEACRRTIEALTTEIAIVEREAALGADVALRRERCEAQLERERARLEVLEQRWHAEASLVARILTIREQLQKDVERSTEAALAPAPRQRLLAELAAGDAELSAMQGDEPLVHPSVDRHAVSAVVSDWTGIPVGRMVRNDVEATLQLSSTLARRVIGQEPALELIARGVQTSRAGLSDPRKPIGVFLLAGPSGVGKTETALALSEALFGGEQSLITINMSEFQEAHTVSTLKGAPPGYVGYGEGGRLTEAVRRRPYSVLLLDEVEKAHPDVHELFFQVFDKGSMEDGEGRSVDFKNTVILLTTNVGTELITQLCADRERMPKPDALAGALRKPLLQIFPPALLGRMVTIPYYPLSEELITTIVRVQLGRVMERARREHGVTLRYDDSVPELITARCTAVESGARMVEAAIAGELLPRLGRALLERLLRGTPLTEVHVGVRAGDFRLEFA